MRSYYQQFSQALYRYSQLLCVMALLMAVPVVSFAQKYITSVAVCQNEKSQVDKMKADGYEVLAIDQSPNVLGYKYTTNGADAISDLLVFIGAQYTPTEDKTFTVNGREYKPCPTYYNNEKYQSINYNDGARFLYYSTTNPQYGAVTKLSTKWDYEKDFNKTKAVQETSDNTKVSDFATAFSWGKWTYWYKNCVIMEKANPVIAAGLPGNRTDVFTVTNLGGGLYEINVPFIVRDESTGYIWKMPLKGTNSVVKHRRKNTNDDFTSLMSFSSDFTSSDASNVNKSWTFRLTRNNKSAEFLYSISLQPIQFPKDDNGIEYSLNWESKNYNGYDLCFVPYLVKLDRDDYEFKFEGKQVQSKNEQRDFSVTLVPSDPESPYDFNAITVVGPALNLFEDEKGKRTLPFGSQQLMLGTGNKMDVIALWDPSTKQFTTKVNPQEDDDYVFAFPSSDKVQKYVAYMYGEHVGGDTIHKAQYAVPFEIPAFHHIRNMKIDVDRKVNDKGVFSQKNIITWQTYNYKAEDAFEEDQYVVQRAYKSDFSDAEPVALIGITGESEEFVKYDERTGIATFTIIDENEKGSHSEVNDSTKMVYYRVARSMALAFNNEKDNDFFVVVDSIMPENYLASVGSIAVEKTDNFDKDKTVKVRVKLPFKYLYSQVKGYDFDKLRANAVKHTDTTKDCFVIRKDKDLFLAIDYDRVFNSEKPFRFDIENNKFKGENGYYLNWADKDASHSQAYLFATQRYSVGFDLDRKNNNIDLSFKRWMSGSDNAWHYIDDGSFGKDEVIWNVVPNSPDILKNAEKWNDVISGSSIFDSNANILIHRYSPEAEHYEGKDYAEKIITIRGSEVKFDVQDSCWYAEIEDVQSTPYTHYYYSASIDRGTSNYLLYDNAPVTSTEAEADACYNETLAPFTKLTASKGTVQGKVVVEWEVDEGLVDEFKIERRVAPTKAIICSDLEKPRSVGSKTGSASGPQIGMLMFDGSRLYFGQDFANPSYAFIKLEPTGKYISFKNATYASYNILVLHQREYESDKYLCKPTGSNQYNLGDKFLALDRTQGTPDEFIIELNNENNYPTNIRPCYKGRASDYKLGVVAGGDLGLVAEDPYWGISLLDYNEKEIITDSPFTELTLSNPKATTYVDENAESGKLYEYRVTARCRIRGEYRSKSEVTAGWNPYFGTIKGKVNLKNGSAMPGEVTVALIGQRKINISEYRDLLNDTIIIPGYNATFCKEITTTDGTFEFDKVPYFSSGTNYKIDVISGNAEFTVNGQSNGSTFDVEIDDASYNQTMIFVCNDTKKFSGRVLYAGSTIPVRDCEFKMNGYPVLDGNGKAVKTDAAGNFAFLLPRVPMTLQVLKNGHTFDNGGFIKGNVKDVTETEHEFVPSDDYVIPTMYDSTTVRLVGRIVGGSRQTKLPLGFGYGYNNLGDDLKLVMELEGDNTAQIVYDPNRPDVTERKEDFAQIVTDNNGIKTKVNETAVSFEKKRIVITPDVKTGEFTVDVVPTKYKITELSAKGYPTLFNDGEGFQVLDLSNDSTVIVAKDTIGVKSFTTSYNSTYQRAYHTPANVTYSQLIYGMEVGYVGSEKMTDTNIAGEKIKVTVAKYDKKTGDVKYTFGAPVFEFGVPYQLLVRAHEDYYYNGEEINAPDVVLLDGGKLKVRNGLESSVSDAEYELDSLGTAVITIYADNPTFSLTEKEALRKLSMQVLSNGYYYDAKPLEAFVTGWRDKGEDVATLDAGLTLFDIVRDPYGSGSYAYREKGTSYHWDRTLKHDVKINFDFDFKLGTTVTVNTGAWMGMGGGSYVGTTSNGSTISTISIPLPFFNGTKKTSAQYDMTLNERVATSSDPDDVGADADIYIGQVNSMNIGKLEVISVIDEKTYKVVENAVKAGAVRILSKSKDDNGEPCYLAISEKYNAYVGKSKDFAYSQKYITGTLIPNLVQMYKSLILTGTRSEIQALANATREVKYRMRDGMNITQDSCYEAIYPDGNQNVKTQKVNPESCCKMIREWIKVIEQNEALKLASVAGGQKSYKTLSVSGGTTVSHTENGGGYYSDSPWVYKMANVNLKNHMLSGNLGISLGAGWGKDKGTGGTEKSDQNGFESEIKTPGYKFGFSVDFKLAYDVDQSLSYNKKVTGETGYYIATNGDSYLDQEIYRVDPFKISEAQLNDEGWKFLLQGQGTSPEDTTAAKVRDYVFVVRGGAQRSPWYDVDTTKYVNPGTPLGAQTLKIDNPKLYIDQPVVSNLPTNEKAVFSVRLTNETELTTGAQLGAGKFTLFLDDKSTPDGVAVTMDGMPITDGRTFSIGLGESITKTIQVERAGNEYDYENIRLGLRDEAGSVVDYAALSVHYLPSSTPLNLMRPTDKWVMNTQSPMDEDGKYYMPVEINGFNIEHTNFDHIELQYKKQTEGDSKWVNLCSFFANDSLYQVASGEKAKIKSSGTIAYRFYGEKDPVEMAYDLRAVSFCRLGTGYVTAVSNIMSGKKDTRKPEVFGKPKPTNGVLTFNDEISIPFNEPIAYNYLDKTANFEVTGFTNNTDNSYETLLRFPELPAGEELDLPTSKVRRNLTGSDFTVDAMVKMDNIENPRGTIFSIMEDQYVDYENPENLTNSENYMLFGVEDNAFLLVLDGMAFVSDKLDDAKYAARQLSLKKDLTHVAVSYRQPGNMTTTDRAQVKFFVNGIEIGLNRIINADNEGLPLDTRVPCKAYGEVAIGGLYQGVMSDMRLWNKAMDQTDINAYRGKKLNGTEPSLLGYWPMDESNGEKMLHDKANGADMYFTQQMWYSTEGHHSLHLNGEPVKLANAGVFERNEYNDYTLSFWYRTDKALNADSVTVFQSGANLNKDRFSIYLSDEGLILQSGQNKYNIANREVAGDNNWHNIIVVANSGQNACALYFDGNLSKTIHTGEMGRMHNSAQLGGVGFVGNIDELTFWHLAFPADCIGMMRNTMPKGTEMGLVYYLPFEMEQRNSQGLLQTVFSPYNEIVTLKENGDIADKTPAFSDEIMSDNAKLDAMDDANTFAPTVKSKGRTNLEFSWTAKDNELQININRPDAEINHQQIFVTVRGVEDLAGNSMDDPQMMAVYVDRNVLAWDREKENVKLNYGEGTTIAAGWYNRSGRNVSYQIQENCTWLKPSAVIGNAQPVSSGEVELEISDGLAPGEYSTVVYLIDEDNLSSPLTINVTVTPDEPMWDVTTDPSYKYNMNLIGQVYLKNNGGNEFLDMDKRDVVAAFYDGVCVGKANLSVDNEANTSKLNMTIYGNDHMLPMVLDSQTTIYKYLTFQLWRASTNEVCVITPNTEMKAIPFIENSFVGCPPEKPVIFTPSREIKQTITLEKGWNWVSFNIIPKNDRGLNQLFDSNNVFEVGDQIMHNYVASTLIKDAYGNLVWSHEKDAVNNLNKLTYQIYVQKPTQATVFGLAYQDNNRFVKLKGRGDDSYVWCDLAYLLAMDQPINIAMSDFANDRAAVGTIIKSHKQFAVMDEKGKWVGSLEYMHPGEGYFVKHFGQDDAVIKYTNVQSTAYSKKNSMFMDWESLAKDDEYAGAFDNQFCAEAKDMMPVIADIDKDEDYREGDEIVAFSKGKMVGYAVPTELEDGRLLFFISINANNGDAVRFAHVRGGEVLSKSSNGISFDGDGTTGTLDVPFMIDFSRTSSASDDDVFGIGGEKYGKMENIKYHHGIFIVNGEKIAK